MKQLFQSIKNFFCPYTKGRARIKTNKPYIWHEARKNKKTGKVEYYWFGKWDDFLVENMTFEEGDFDMESSYPTKYN